MAPFPLRTKYSAAIGGAAWTLKVAVITAIDGSFDPLESVLFDVGLLAIVVAATSAGWHLTRTHNPVVRVAGAFGAIVAVSLITTGLESGVRAGVGALYSGHNQGISDESGILAIAVLALVMAAVIPTGRPAGQTRAMANSSSAAS